MFKMAKKPRAWDRYGDHLVVKAKPPDKKGTTLVRITYPPLNVLLSSFLLPSNQTTLQTPFYQVLDLKTDQSKRDILNDYVFPILPLDSCNI